MKLIFRMGFEIEEEEEEETTTIKTTFYVLSLSIIVICTHFCVWMKIFKQKSRLLPCFLLPFERMPFPKRGCREEVTSHLQKLIFLPPFASHTHTFILKSIFWNFFWIVSQTSVEQDERKFDFGKFDDFHCRHRHSFTRMMAFVWF